MSEKREKELIMFVLLALYLSLMETLVPKPVPWFKIGLANIVTLIVIIKYDKKMAFEVFFLRAFIQGLMLGTLFSPGFVISTVSGGISTFLTILLFNYRKYLSILSISITAAIVHNFMQMVVVYFLMFRGISLNSREVIIFILIFLTIGLVSGSITGILCTKLKLRRKGEEL